MAVTAPASQTRAMPSNEDKAKLWRDYFAGNPRRVPVRLNSNPRIFLMNPALNTQGYTFEAAARDPKTHVEVQLRWQHHLRQTINTVTDSPTGLPEFWEVGLRLYNVTEAAAMGATVQFPPDQVPCTEPMLTDADKHSIFERDIHHPLERGYLKECMDFWHEMERVCKDLSFEGRPVRLAPFAPCHTDGPVTVACNLRGVEFLEDLVEDPDYADRLMGFITDAAIARRKAFYAYWGDRVEKYNGLADDSCAMLGAEMYTRRVLPHHLRYYESLDASLPRSIHLCGNASHLFPIMHERMNVVGFDTGFPIDFSKTRRALGPQVEISGGPRVDLLLRGTPDDIYRHTRSILLSGVTAGRRFILQEGNNLPPNTPMDNLRAMYQAALDWGRYGERSSMSDER